MNLGIDYFFARLKVEGIAPIVGSIIAGIIITLIIYSPIIEFSIYIPSNYKITISMLLSWTTSFSVVALLFYWAILIKDFGSFVFSVPLLALFGTLSWVRDDLQNSSLMLERSFHSVEFFAQNITEEVFLTDTYYFIQSLIIIIILLLISIHYLVNNNDSS